MKKKTSSKTISQLCEKLRTDLEDWDKIPNTIKVKDEKKEREALYREIKKKMEHLAD